MSYLRQAVVDSIMPAIYLVEDHLLLRRGKPAWVYGLVRIPVLDLCISVHYVCLHFFLHGRPVPIRLIALAVGLLAHHVISQAQQFAPRPACAVWPNTRGLMAGAPHACPNACTAMSSAATTAPPRPRTGGHLLGPGPAPWLHQRRADACPAPTLPSFAVPCSSRTLLSPSVHKLHPRAKLRRGGGRMFW